jgi:hypothetical protein
MRRAARWAGAAAIILLAACGAPKPTNNTSSSSPTPSSSDLDSAASLQKALDDARVNATWVYTETPDRMTEQPMRMACVSSEDQIQVGDTQTTTAVCVRRTSDGDAQVVLHVNTPGVFRCQTPYICIMRLRLDGGAPFYVHPSIAQDGSGDVVVTSYESQDLIRRLAQADKMLMEADYEGTAAQITAINVAHLDLGRLGLESTVSEVAEPESAAEPANK